MNFLVFIAMYLLCTLFFGSIAYFVIKFLFHKKMFSVSKFAEKEIDRYFNAYDDNFENLTNLFNEEEDNSYANTIDGQTGNGKNIDLN